MKQNGTLKELRSSTETWTAPQDKEDFIATAAEQLISDEVSPQAGNRLGAIPELVEGNFELLFRTASLSVYGGISTMV